MPETDHKFYSLSEAAERLGCPPSDLLKLGASGRLSLYLWVKIPVIRERSLAKCDLGGKGKIKDYDFLTSPPPRFMPISEEEAMSAYLDQDRFFQKGYFFEKDKVTHLANEISFSADDLFVMNDGIRAVASAGEEEQGNNYSEDKEIGKKERRTWLKIVYLLTEIAADKRPGLKFENGEVNASELCRMPTEKAKELEIDTYGLAKKPEQIVKEWTEEFLEI